MKELKLIIFPIFLFFILIGMVYLFTSGTLESLMPTIDGTANQDSAGIIPDGPYVFKPAANTSGREFKLTYPSNWIISENARDEATGVLNVSFTSEDGSYFEIIQGVKDGGRCVFKDESDFSNFNERGLSFNSYTQFKKGNLTWRLAKFDIETDWTHALCEANKNAEGKTTYTSINSVGFNRISLLTPEAIKEFANILNKLEVK